MAKAKRVHEVAKELGLSSKDIVAKCQAEGITDVTNHMSTVKLGLQQTIRDWFADAPAGSDGDGESDASGDGETQASPAASRTAVDEAPSNRAGSPAQTRAAARRKAVRRDAEVQEASQAAAESAARTARARPASRPASADADATDQADKAGAAGPSEGDPQPDVEAKSSAPTEAPRDSDAADHGSAEDDAVQTLTTPAPADSAVDSSTDSQVTGQADAPAASSASSGHEGQAPSAPAGSERADQPASPAAAGEPTDAEDESPSEPVAARGQVNVPRRPDVIRPVGETLGKPQGVQLRGPRVVRVEKAEEVAPPRPRRAPRENAGAGAPSGSSPDGSVPGITRTRGPARGRGAGGPATGDDAAAGRGNKRRTGNTRRGGRANDSIAVRGQMSEQDMLELDARLKGAPGFLKKQRRSLKTREGGQQAQSALVTGGKVEIAEPITIKALSAATGMKSADVIKYLFQKGVMATINSAIDSDMALEVALEYDIELVIKEQQTAEEKILGEFEDRQTIDERRRPPVVTVLGHVDHGKTSLLDRIRKADVAAHEAGGITQHVGAYRVTVTGSDGGEKTVVFLDTPGHEAFTTMRARGAKMTDMVVLVVAADDGVMPQTIESINHAKAAGVPIIVALNKCDTPRATDDNIQKIYGQLAEHELSPTVWGGETEVIKTSAITGDGVNDLLETLDLQAELLDLKADYGGTARGTVIEAEMQPGRGSVARVLVQDGTLSVGDFIVIGRAFGRVREMSDDRNRAVLSAGPATPLELSGIDDVPDAGDKFYVTTTLKRAEEIAEQYREKERHRTLASQTKVTLETFADTIRAGQVQELKVVLKADVQGTLTVLKKSLEDLGNDEVGVRVIHSAVGGVTENDVLLAEASDAIIVGFHVGITPVVREIAEQRKVDVRMYTVIYDLTDEVTRALEGMLTPETRETQIGAAQVKEVFRIGKVGLVAGCLVTDGMVQRSGLIRVQRDGGVVTQDRKIESLRRVKDEAREVRVGTECGIRIENFDDLKPGDQLICYSKTEVKRTLA